jgi:PAS domain S-box-containing protein
MTSGGTDAGPAPPLAEGSARTRSRLRRAFGTLQARLYGLVLLALLPAVAIQLWAALATLREREAEAHADMLRLARFAAGELDRIIEVERGVLAAIAATPAVLEADWPACDAYLARLGERFPETTGFGVLDAEGQLVCTSQPSPDPDYSDRPHFIAARDGGAFVIGTYLVGRVSGRPLLPLALPRYGADGSFAGVVFTGIDLGWLHDYFARRDLPPGGALNVVDRDATVVLRLPAIPGVAGSTVDAEIISMLDLPSPGSREFTNRQGRRVIFGYAPLSTPPVGLFVTVSSGRDALMAAYRSSAWRNALLILATLAAALAAAAIGGRYFLRRPIARMAEVIERWRDGDLGARIGRSQDGGDFGRLGALFDGMADTLGRRAEEIAAERERLSLVADAMPALVSFCDAERRYRFVNRGYEEWFGRPREAFLGRRVDEVVGREAYELVRPHMDAALAGETRSFVARLPYRDAGLRHVEVKYVPAVREGVVEGFYVFVEDVTEPKRREGLQAAQKAALELAIGGAGLRATMRSLVAAAAELLDGSAAMFVLDAGRHVLRLQAAGGLPEAFRAAVDPLPIGPDSPGCGRAVHVGARVIVPDVAEDPDWAALRALAQDSGVRSSWSTPVLQFGGAVLGSLAVYHDAPRRPTAQELACIDGLVQTAAVLIDRQRAEDHQRLLMAELNHRVKNTMAIVQSIATQSLRDAPDPEEAVATFGERLRALAAAHDALTAESWSGADLRTLIEAGVAAVEDRAVVTIDGPPVRLGPRIALSLSMALHELATNAVKHGALAAPEGRVAIDWRLEGAGAERRLRLRWRERGGPPVAPPARRGFGSRMLERALAADTRGRATLDFAPEGLVFELDAPLPAEAADAAS